MNERRKESKLKDFCSGGLGLIFLATVLLSEGVYQVKEYFRTLPYRVL